MNEKLLWQQIGKRLREARLRRKLTLEGAVALLPFPLTFGALGHYERGIRPVPLPELIELARVLHTTPGEVYGLGETDMMLQQDELQLINAFRRLPLDDRQKYLERITGLAKLYGDPVPDERLPQVWSKPIAKKPAKSKPKPRRIPL